MNSSEDPKPLPVIQEARALALMRGALVLLDEAGATLAASRLQHAIDTLDPPQPVEPEE
ncbi:hypothetical protein [Sphingomonas sp. HMP9]|uniref:hypothetical protein n=1 Tax=Sphingomonas sp. HMP9 TaxID=1517554 RepID=UPI001596C8EE|nr:hypothetical protein [Sphingomonas sp. HMP9]